MEKVDRNQFLKAVVDGNHISIQPDSYPADKDSILNWAKYKEKLAEEKEINKYDKDVPLLTGEVYKITIRETRKELNKLNF